jgi:hypothetical protein
MDTVLENGNTRESMLTNGLNQLIDAGVIPQGDDFDQRDHRVAHTRVTEAENPTNHPPFMHPQSAAAIGQADQQAQLFFGDKGILVLRLQTEEAEPLAD